MLHPLHNSARPLYSTRDHSHQNAPHHLLHNVQERTASPAKRIKTDEDRKKSTHRQGFNGGSSLELQKTSSQAPSQTGPSIDLTMSDDDDVQLVGDNMEELICVGKVKHTYVQAHTVPYPDPKKYLGNSGQQGRIKVSFRRAGNNRNNLNIMVTDPTGREFGRVDMKSSTGLCPLIDGAKANGLIWMAWTDIRRKQAGEGPPGSPFSGLISMTLQFCYDPFSSSSATTTTTHKMATLLHGSKR
ncbi:hypothetical protein HBH70_250360 [Parastagonospora nodorum]|nr:hypothetical protein HBH70_250360 [Parastagonospora nodorum]